MKNAGLKNMLMKEVLLKLYACSVCVCVCVCVCVQAQGFQRLQKPLPTMVWGWV